MEDVAVRTPEDPTFGEFLVPKVSSPSPLWVMSSVCPKGAGRHLPKIENLP